MFNNSLKSNSSDNSANRNSTQSSNGNRSQNSSNKKSSGYNSDSNGSNQSGRLGSGGSRSSQYDSKILLSVQPVPNEEYFNYNNHHVRLQ